MPTIHLRGEILRVDDQVCKIVCIMVVDHNIRVYVRTAVVTKQTNRPRSVATGARPISGATGAALPTEMCDLHCSVPSSISGMNDITVANFTPCLVRRIVNHKQRTAYRAPSLCDDKVSQTNFLRRPLKTCQGNRSTRTTPLAIAGRSSELTTGTREDTQYKTRHDCATK